MGLVYLPTFIQYTFSLKINQMEVKYMDGMGMYMHLHFGGFLWIRVE